MTADSDSADADILALVAELRGRIEALVEATPAELGNGRLIVMAVLARLIAELFDQGKVRPTRHPIGQTISLAVACYMTMGENYTENPLNQLMFMTVNILDDTADELIASLPDD